MKTVNVSYKQNCSYLSIYILFRVDCSRAQLVCLMLELKLAHLLSRPAGLVGPPILQACLACAVPDTNTLVC